MSVQLPWSAQQREWLAALGHDVLSLADASPVPAPGAPVASPPPRQPDRAADRLERTAPAPTTARTAPARAPTETALLRALAQAARRAPDDGEFLRALPPLASLRGNPAARRALWPRLRALRRGARP